MEATQETRKRSGITQFIIENDSSPNPLSFIDIADKFGVAVGSVYSIASRLRAMGRLKPAWRQPSRRRKYLDAPASVLDKAPSTWTPADLEGIDKLPVLTPDQRKKLLSAIGMRPSQGTSQVNALVKLDDLDRDAGHIGPPAPLTEDQQADRLSRLMRAVGRPTTERAMEVAFAEKANASEPPAVQS